MNINKLFGVSNELRKDEVEKEVQSNMLCRGIKLIHQKYRE